MNAQYSQKLQKLLYDFHNLTGMKTCVYGFAQTELCFYPEKLSSFCALLRRDKSLDEKCRECDRRAFAECKKTHRRAVYTCHAGLLECFSPVLYKDSVIGYIVIGQIRAGENADFEGIKDRLPVNLQPALQEAYESLPAVPPDKIKSAVHILDACAGYEYLKALISGMENRIDGRIAGYIESNLTGDLSVNAICRVFHLSRNEIYSIFREYFNSSVADFVRERRLGKARDLLESSELPIVKIAELAGLADYNYFSKQFKAAFGVSPSRYRKNSLND